MCTMCLQTNSHLSVVIQYLFLLQVTVEYGADLHSSVHGSGFPMCMCEEEDSCCNGGCVQDNGEFQYTKSGWNLNNIPNLRVGRLHVQYDSTAWV